MFCLIYEFRNALRNSDVIMFIDNVGVLAMLSKRAASPEGLTHVGGMIHLILAACDIRVWWEYVESAANPSDGLSRLFDKDPL